MNYLFGKITFGSKGNKLITHDLNKFTCDNVYLYAERIHVFKFDTKPIFFNEQTNIVCAMIGYVSNLDELRRAYDINYENDVELIERLYYLKKADLIHDLDGLFTIFILDRNIQKAYIFQDELGSNLPLYYTLSDSEVVFSTCLKRLLKCTTFKRDLNVDGVYDFLFPGFVYYGNIIPNESTLIRHVNKLVPRKIIAVDIRAYSAEIKELHLAERKTSRSAAKKELMDNLENAISSMYNDLREKNVSLALSSGFDTNYLLSKLREIGNGALNAFTLGGKEINEVPQAKAIVNVYNNVKHFPKIIEENALNSFPDIVWRLEGYVCQTGVFLQYELAKQLYMERCPSVFLGEGADQQTNFLMHSLLAKAYGSIFLSLAGMAYLYMVIKKQPLSQVKKTVDLFFYFKKKASRNYCHDIMLDYILKKNGIMLNSYNVQGIYPFLTKKVRNSCKSLGLFNVNKRYYKQEVKKCLNPGVLQYLGKAGGTTDIEYLFYPKLNLILEKIAESELVNMLLTESWIKKISENPQPYCHLISQLLYLYVFDALFISGKYDAKFEDTHLDVSLDHFL